MHTLESLQELALAWHKADHTEHNANIFVSQVRSVQGWFDIDHGSMLRNVQVMLQKCSTCDWKILYLPSSRCNSREHPECMFRIHNECLRKTAAANFPVNCTCGRQLPLKNRIHDKTQNEQDVLTAIQHGGNDGPGSDDGMPADGVDAGGYAAPGQPDPPVPHGQEVDNDQMNPSLFVQQQVHRIARNIMQRGIVLREVAENTQMSPQEMRTAVQQITHGVQSMTAFTTPAIAPALMITQADIDDEQAAYDEADGNGA